MNEKMKPRQSEILKCLITSTTPLELEYFESKFGKSARTIRYDISELKELCEENGAEIRYQMKKGYYIPQNEKMKCQKLLSQVSTQAEQDFLFDADEERFKQLFLYLFVQKDKITADQVAEHFFVSKSTLIRLLNKNQKNNPYENSIVSKNGKYHLGESETTIRKNAAEIIEKYLNNIDATNYGYDGIPEIIKQYMSFNELSRIVNGIKKVNDQFNIWVSKESFRALLAGCIVRNIRYYRIKSFEGEKITNQVFSEYVLALLKEISIPNEKTDVVEARRMEEILSGSAEIRTFKETEYSLEINVSSMLKEFQKKFEDRLGLIDYENLKTELVEHLKNSLSVTFLYDTQGDENLVVVTEVKENYPDFYDVAKDCTEYLEKKINVPFSETEVCYIAVYLYKNCISKNDNVKKNVLVVCATGRGLSHLLTIRIERFFPNLNIIGQTSPYQLLRNKYAEQVDLILSTIPIENTAIPVIRISKILSMEDVEHIREYLETGKTQKNTLIKNESEVTKGTRNDPFNLSDVNFDSDKSTLTSASAIISKLILTLMEYLSKLPEEYRPTQDAILGLIIHMSMAVPRWYEKTERSESEGFREEYNRIKEQNPEVYQIMEQFFTLVENSLKIKIVPEERTAFFLYIIKEENEDEKASD